MSVGERALAGPLSVQLTEIVARLRPATLVETVEAAELQTRFDRKYVLPPSAVASLVRELGNEIQALQIGQERCAAYESVYFDTPDRHSYRGANTERRRRWKVRTRTYAESGECMLEVKTRDAHGQTAKERMPHAVGAGRHLTNAALAFIAERVRLPDQGRELSPVLTTRYRRATLLDRAAGVRLTIDTDLVCTATNGNAISLSDHLLVETKSTGAPTAADRLLWSAGFRPMAISKFGVGLAGTDPTLSANRWNRPLRRYFGWTPARR